MFHRGLVFQVVPKDTLSRVPREFLTATKQITEGGNEIITVFISQVCGGQKKTKTNYGAFVAEHFSACRSENCGGNSNLSSSVQFSIFLGYFLPILPSVRAPPTNAYLLHLSSVGWIGYSLSLSFSSVIFFSPREKYQGRKGRWDKGPFSSSLPSCRGRQSLDR